MKHLKFLFALGGILFLSCQTVSARGLKIPFGDREVLTKVADLPDTEEYQTDDGNYIDLATFHQEFNIAYLLPLYIEKEPRLVGYCEKEDTYYELTEEQLATILKENNLDGEKLNKIGFYSRYGGKAVGLLIIALIIWGCIPGKKRSETRGSIKQTIINNIKSTNYVYLHLYSGHFHCSISRILVLHEKQKLETGTSSEQHRFQS